MSRHSERAILAMARIMRCRLDRSEQTLRSLQKDVLTVRDDHESLKIEESAWYQRKQAWEHKIYDTSHMLGKDGECRRVGGEMIKQMDSHLAKVAQRRRLAASSLQIVEDKCSAQRMAILNEKRRRDALMARAKDMRRRRRIQAEED